MAEFGEAEAIDPGGDEEEGRRSDGRGREEAAGGEEMTVCVARMLLFNAQSIVEGAIGGLRCCSKSGDFVIIIRKIRTMVRDGVASLHSIASEINVNTR